jgi:hypothetical protein
VKPGHILGDTVSVLDALEIMKFLGNFQNAIGIIPGSWEAALITPQSQEQGVPRIADAVQILRALSDNSSLVEAQANPFIATRREVNNRFSFSNMYFDTESLRVCDNISSDGDVSALSVGLHFVETLTFAAVVNPSSSTIPINTTLAYFDAYGKGEVHLIGTLVLDCISSGEISKIPVDILINNYTGNERCPDRCICISGCHPLCPADCDCVRCDPPKNLREDWYNWLDDYVITSDDLEKIKSDGELVCFDVWNFFAVIDPATITSTDRDIDLGMSFIEYEEWLFPPNPNHPYAVRDALIILPNEEGEFGFELQFHIPLRILFYYDFDLTGFNLWQIAKDGTVTEKTDFTYLPDGSVMIKITDASSRYELSTRNHSRNHGFIANNGTGQRVGINDALELLKFLAGISDNALKGGVSSASWQNALLTRQSINNNRPGISDVLEILKYLVKIRPNGIDNPIL